MPPPEVCFQFLELCQSTPSSVLASTNDTKVCRQETVKCHSNKVPVSAELHACDPGGTESFRWNVWKKTGLEEDLTINQKGLRQD